MSLGKKKEENKLIKKKKIPIAVYQLCLYGYAIMKNPLHVVGRRKNDSDKTFSFNIHDRRQLQLPCSSRKW